MSEVISPAEASGEEQVLSCECLSEIIPLFGIVSGP